jgi:glycine/D-amino acid oxidase-like deaminating enzyme
VAWRELIEVLEAELGPAGADRLDHALRAAFGGERLYVPAAERVDPEQAAQAVAEAPSARIAAQRLGVHVTTIYRKLEQRRIR